MGRTFYHNTPINQATLNFNFAHVYSSRREMDSRVLSDGVYVGRYVLIEYDKAFEPIARNDDGTFDFKSSFSYKLAYAMTYDSQGNPNRWTRVRYKNVDYNAASGKTFLTAAIGNEAKVIILTETPVYDDDPNTDNPELDGTSVIGVQPGTIVSVKNNSSNKYEFYKVISTSVDWNKPAQFEKLDIWCENSIVHYGNNHTIDLNGSAEQQRSTIYAANYAYDNENYPGLGRGYDSTVWQKTLVNGIATYVQIAELNTVTPTFDLIVDPPSENSEAPYFDPISSNVYYLLHENPSWGFRIKGAQGNYTGKTIDSNGHETNKNVNYSIDNTHYASDVNIQWMRNYEGQTQYFNGTLSKWSTARSNSLPGAIYFNKDGFNPNTIHYSSEDLFESNSWNGENAITVTPTGQSGLEYGDTRISEDGGQTAPDIQELSIMLPVIGDTVNELWNLIYGDETINQIHYDSINGIINPVSSDYDGKTRETDITWYNANVSEQEKTKGLRLVDYNIGPDGTYTYAPNEIKTIAGCINSVHDLMGMIIYPLEEQINDPTVIERLSPDYIYYFNNKYWRRGAETYLNADFNPDELYKEINVIPFNENDKYFYRDLTNFKRLVGEPNTELTYYKFNTEANSFILQTNELKDPKDDPPYYYADSRPKPGTLIRVNEADNQRAYFCPDLQQRDVAFYQSNVYYTKIDPNGPISTGNLEKSIAETKDDGTIYYYQYTYTIYDPAINNTKEITEYQGISGEDLVQWEPGLNYYEYIDGKYVPVTSPIFYTVDPLNLPKEGQGVNLKLSLWQCVNPQSLQAPLQFYFPNTYYYKSYFGEDADSTDSGTPENKKYDYYLDSNPQKIEGRRYYLLQKDPVQVDKFYEKNKFYYLDNNEYVIDRSSTWTSERQYYDNLKLYVKEDLTGFYKIGSEWNQDLGTHNEFLGTYDPTYGSQNWVSFDKTTESDDIPPELLTGTKVGTKEIKYKLYEMPEFARNLNTIHGMLLKINSILNTDDVLTRDTKTVQGCINSINDILDLYGGLKRNQPVIVDENGKFTSATPIGDDWLEYTVDGDPEVREIIIEHKTLDSTRDAVNLTTTNTIIDKNTEQPINNEIVLTTYSFDNAGHVRNSHTDTVRLPFGFKTIINSAQSTEDGLWSTAAQERTFIVADSTQDELTISTGNKWIRTVTDSNLDSLTLAHETHTVTPNNTPTSSLSSTSTVPSIIISQYGYDYAGHITSETNTTVSGVASYGIIIGDNNTSTTASASLDTLAITGDTWIGTSAANDAITLTHKAPAAVIPTAQSNDAPSFGNTFSITDWHFDSTGHKDGSSTHTVTIPQGSLVDDNTEYTSSANVLTGITFASSSGRIGYTHQNASTLLLTGYNSAHSIINPNGSIGDAFAAIEGKFNTLENNISSNDDDITTLQNSVNTINNTTIPNITNNIIPGAIRDLIGGATAAFDTLKEVEDWINDGNSGAAALVTRVSTLETNLSNTNDNTVNGSLAYRISALETDIGNLSGNGSGSISSQIDAAINDYDSGKNFGDVITHDASEFESVGAASAVQGNTQSTIEDIEDALDDYIAKTDTFTYDNSDPLDPIEMTVAQLVAYVKTLEDRIYDLENPQSGGDPEPGGGDDEPTPQPSTPDVVIEFTQGVGSVTSGTFNDVLSNSTNLTYSVIIDNNEIDLDEITPVEVEEDNGVYTIIINLDDLTYEKITWTNDGNDDTLTLVPIQVGP